MSGILLVSEWKDILDLNGFNGQYHSELCLCGHNTETK